MSLSTRKRRKSKAGKPNKPSKDFPLFPHNNGQWAKKVRGKILFFGVWGDPRKALEKWLAGKDDLLAGRTPRAKLTELTVAVLCNHFVSSKDSLVESGEIKQRTRDELYATCKRLVDT